MARSEFNYRRVEFIRLAVLFGATQMSLIEWRVIELKIFVRAQVTYYERPNEQIIQLTDERMFFLVYIELKLVENK